MTLMMKIIVRLKTIVIILVNTEVLPHSLCNLIYTIPKEIPMIFHIRSNYDYYLIIKELAKWFDGEVNCL